MKTIIYNNFSILLTLALLSFLVLGCKKNDIPEISRNILIYAKYDSPSTKLTHSLAGKKLKTAWEAGDQILLYDENQGYIFNQYGTIEDDGHSTYFTGNCLEIEGKAFTAYYPPKMNHDLRKQTGKIKDLANLDVLSASGKVSGASIENLAFSSMCSIVQIPAGAQLAGESYSGNVKLTLSGHNVGGVITARSIQQTTIELQASVSKGKLQEDVFISFAPISKTGNYKYTLYTDKGSAFSFNISDISSTCFYIVKNLKKESVQFEDASFEAYCLENFDTDKDGTISIEEALAVEEIYLSNIISLKGIEYFENLKFISLWNVSQQKVDFWNNLKLEYLYVNYSSVSSLDVSKNTTLLELYCSSNQLTELDVSNCSSLKTLSCSSNQLTELDVSNCSSLKTLSCFSNQLTELDVSKNTALLELYCGTNHILELDVSKNTALLYLHCDNLQLTSLNISECRDLIRIKCNNNSIKNLDISNLTALQYLGCWNNQLTSLKVGKNTALETLNCWENHLTELDAGENTNLTSVNCSFNELIRLDITNCNNLAYLECVNNQLTSLEISKLPLLRHLVCEKNKLSSLDVSGKAFLEDLYCGENQLTSLNVKGCKSLKKLFCDSNLLSTLDVSTCSKLEILWAWAANNNTLKMLIKKKGQQISYNREPANYGTTIVEVD